MKSTKQHLGVVALILLVMAVVLSFLHAQTSTVVLTNQPATAVTTTVNETRLADAYGKLPLSFEANHGQVDRQVKFLSRGSGYALFLTRNEAVLALRKGNLERKQSPAVPPTPGKHVSSETTDFLRMRLVGANPAVRVSGMGEFPGKSNYFVSNDPAKWQTNVSTYAQVKYEEVYRGVDLIYYGNQQKLEYDFVVAPGADLQTIRLHFRGASKVKIDEQGSLVLEKQRDRDAVRFERPKVYQEIDGKRRTIEGQYVLKVGSTVGFKVGTYDWTKPLIIDPVLVYATYLGGSNTDGGNGIAVDSSGNAYVIGSTLSTDFPTVNALQSSYGGAFIAKINASGSALVYSTYLGGSGGDYGQGIAVDSSGNAYVTGSTTSTNFPTVNPIQSTYGGFSDAFIAKINASGSALVYSTYLGGTGLDEGAGIAVDSSGNAYVTGRTSSANFPTVNALQASFAGNANFTNAFIAKINASGSALVYSTYLGGLGSDDGAGIAVDSSGNAYVTGSTNSANFPIANAIQSSYGGDQDAFIAKINASGSALVYSTFLGGSGSEDGYGIAVDPSGNAYVTGLTYSTDFPTVNPFQPNCNGCANVNPPSDAFITEINTSGSALVYSTFLGGSGSEEGYGIAVDPSGNAYVTGLTDSTNFPTVNAIQSSLSGTGNAFVAEIYASGSALAYSSYLGGTDFESGAGIAVDSSGNAYVIGSTLSTDFPAVNALQTSCNSCITGKSDAFVAKIFSAVNLLPQILTFTRQPVDTISTPQSIVLSNEGNSPLAISSLAISGTNASDFAETDNCVGNVSVGASCTINVTFEPTATGQRTGMLAIANNFTSSPLTALLNGAGITAARIANLSANTLIFAGQVVGSTSTGQALTLSNTGNAALTISNLSISGLNASDFAETDNCVGNVSVGASCTINVTFEPTATGQRTGTLSITDNATSPQSPQTVPLTGTGITPAVSISPSSISFPNQYVGTAGLPQNVTVTNTGTAPLTISSITTSHTDFGSLSACGNNLASGSSCTIGVFFDPTVGGLRTGDLTITDNVSGSPQTVALSGTGQDFSVTPASSQAATVAPGQTASYALTVIPNGGFGQSVAVTCSGAPSQSTCAVSPNSVVLNGSASASLTVTVMTTAASLLVRKPPASSPIFIGAYQPISLILGLLGLALLASLPSRHRGEPSRPTCGLALLLLLYAGAMMSGCGGGGGGISGTPEGTYTLVISGTFTSGSTTLTRSTNLTLTVQ